MSDQESKQETLRILRVLQMQMMQPYLAREAKNKKRREAYRKKKGLPPESAREEGIFQQILKLRDEGTINVNWRDEGSIKE